MPSFAPALFAALLLSAAPAGAQRLAQPVEPVIIPPPTAEDWAALAELPDLSGTWSPDIRDQFAQMESNPTPWKPEIQEQVDYWFAEEEAGRPKPLLVDCLPHGMPTFMLITHNAIEFLPTPGRITILGESDGNRLRRIHTDGRAMPEDPDPSFHGYSVGQWDEEGVLHVETTAILPQVYLAISEAVGIPNNGDMTISEKIHLLDEDTLAFDMVITAPNILTEPWETRRIYHRMRYDTHEINEGVCRRGDFMEAEDQWGNAIFEPNHQDGLGNILPPPLEE